MVLQGNISTHGNEANRPVNELLYQSAVKAKKSERTYIEIEVIGLQSLKSLSQAVRDIWLVGVPDFGSNENLRARDTTFFDTLPNFRLILIDQGAVQVTVSILESMGNCSLNLARRRLPGT